MNETLKSKTVFGFIWSFIEVIMNQGTQFIIQIILARLLLPDDFGVIGMITIFIAVSNSIVDSGLSNALIREKEINNTKYSTIFYFNLLISLCMYALLYFIAPLVAQFYSEPKLISILRILSLSIIINSFGLIQKTILIRKIDFKSQTKITMISSIISGFIAVASAFSGLGVWSLVLRTLSMSILQSLLLFIHNRWIPKLVFSIRDFKKLFCFGWRMLVSGLIDTLYVNLYYLIIGKSFSAMTLGYYTNACKLKDTISQSITGAVQKVSLPVLSNINGNNANLKNAYKKILKNTAFIVFPIMVGLSAVGDSIITILFGEKWIPSIVYFQILCLEAMLYPIHAINLNILQVKGRADLFLKLEIIKKIVGIAFIAIAIFLKSGINGLLAVAVFVSYIDYFINSMYSKKLINYSIKEQLRDLMPILAISFVMGIFVYLIKLISHVNAIELLFMQILAGIIIYITEARAIKSNELKVMLGIIRTLVRKPINKEV